MRTRMANLSRDAAQKVRAQEGDYDKRNPRVSGEKGKHDNSSIDEEMDEAQRGGVRAAVLSHQRVSAASVGLPPPLVGGGHGPGG